LPLRLIPFGAFFIIQMGEIKDKISKVESGNNYKAVNKASNASGKYQFVRSTWEGLGYDWDKRFDEKLQEEAMAKLTSLNKNAFISKFKTEPTDSDLYGMHFLGTAGYSKVKQANPNTPISELIKGQAYNLNKNVFEKNGRPITVSEFNGWLTKKMGTGVSQVNSQTTSQEQPQVGYVGMLPNGLPEVYGQPYVAEEKVKEEETAEASKRTDNANKLGFVADYEELAKQYEQQLQAQQKPILQQEIVEGVQYQPIQQEFQEGGVKIDPQGYWNPDNEGKPVIIPSPSITTKGISYPIYGKSLETGEVKLMTPNNEYFFANTKNVLETPIYEKK